MFRVQFRTERERTKRETRRKGSETIPRYIDDDC